MYYSFFFLIALVLEGLGQMDCAGVAGVIPGLKGASATCNLQPGNQLDCLLQIPEPRKSTGLIQIRKIPQPGKKAIALCLIHYQVVHKGASSVHMTKHLYDVRLHDLVYMTSICMT